MNYNSELTGKDHFSSQISFFSRIIGSKKGHLNLSVRLIFAESKSFPETVDWPRRMFISPVSGTTCLCCRNFSNGRINFCFHSDSQMVYKCVCVCVFELFYYVLGIRSFQLRFELQKSRHLLSTNDVASTPGLALCRHVSPSQGA